MRRTRIAGRVSQVELACTNLRKAIYEAHQTLREEIMREGVSRDEAERQAARSGV